MARTWLPRAVTAAALLGLGCAGCTRKGDATVRLVAVGDILLARQVAKELRATGASPWRDWGGLFADPALVLGNLEGAVGTGCAASDAAHPCFALAPDAVHALAGTGFDLLSLANNHARDGDGPEATRAALAREGLQGVTAAGSPRFLRVGGVSFGVVAVDLVSPRPQRDEVPSLALAEKLRLARALADVVVVSVHWGVELVPWPSGEQEDAARWLVRHGADVVFGHHPHVVQPATCVEGRPVFYSLGNHLFDQKYPETRAGLVAECAVDERGLTCGGRKTTADLHGFTPHPGELDAGVHRALADCRVPLRPRLTVDGWRLGAGSGSGADALVLEGERAGAAWRTAPRSAQSAELLATKDGEQLLVVVEPHVSRLDGELAPRPYVYRPAADGLRAAWRGTALAWPLVATRALADGVLCACHRGDSFLVPDATLGARRLMAYRWNGFGFDAVSDGAVEQRCGAAFEGLCSATAVTTLR